MAQHLADHYTEGGASGARREALPKPELKVIMFSLFRRRDPRTPVKSWMRAVDVTDPRVTAVLSFTGR
jgi:hypothetical protein